MRSHPKLDDNHPEIVKALRVCGYSVQSLASIGRGCPDILVGLHGRNYLFEIKDGDKPVNKRALTPDEFYWHGAWRGQVNIVTNVNAIIDYIKSNQTTEKAR